MFSAIRQLAKSTELIAHWVTLLENELRTLRQANQALAKCRRAKYTRIQAGGVLTVKDTQVLIAAIGSGSQQSGERLPGGGVSEVRLAMEQRCGNCSKTGHNVRTCQKVEKTSEKDSCIVYSWFFCIIIEQLRLEVMSEWKSTWVADMHGSLMNHVNISYLIMDLVAIK